MSERRIVLKESDLARLEGAKATLNAIVVLARLMATGVHRRGEHVMFWRILAKELGEGGDCAGLVEIVLDDVALRQPVSLTKFSHMKESVTRLVAESAQPRPKRPAKKAK